VASGVWQLPPVPILGGRGRREADARCRAACYAALRESPDRVFILLAENPPDPELATLLEPCDDGAWAVPGGDLRRNPLDSELAVGGWLAYSAADPVSERIPELFRGDPEELAAWAKRNDISILIASFHDDTEWTVVVADRPGPEAR